MEELDDFEAFVRTIGGLVNSGAQVDIVQLGTGIFILSEWNCTLYT